MSTSFISDAATFYSVTFTSSFCEGKTLIMINMRLIGGMNMRKISYLIGILLLLMGCSQEIVEQPKEPEKKNTEENIVKNEQKKKGETNEVEKEEINEDVVIQEEKDEPSYYVDEKTWLMKPLNEEVNKKVVLITIDDAPDKYAVEMAKTLKELNQPAIFFVNGHFIQDEEGKKHLKAIKELEFHIGNHTMNHKNLKKLSPEEQRKEIIELNQLIEDIIGEKPKFFRAPFGVNTDVSNQVAKEEKMVVMNWTYGYDWEKEYQSKDAIIDVMVSTPLLKDGSILLMHDRPWTHEGLQSIITGLMDKGYEILDPNLIKTE